MSGNIFRGRTIEEAISLVKKTLGPDAMILSTKRLKDKDQRDYFQIEAMPHEKNSMDYNYENKNIRSEIMSIKEMLLIREYMDGFFERLISNLNMFNFYVKLLRHGVDIRYIKRFFHKAVNKKEANCSELELKKEVINQIKGSIKINEPFKNVKKERIITAMIGTTGVGKTTTIAKLSANLMLNYGYKLGIISLDTYRIGAMDQLKRYTDIMGVPFYQVYKKKDLVLALRKLSEKDVILIDTAGLSHYDNMRIREMERLFDNNVSISTHLLISAPTIEEEMMNISNNFKSLNYLSIIYTKIDETRYFGSMLNHMIKSGKPVSYFTTGQRVPDDIEKAKAEKIVRLLIN